jgi:hypothetical protein
MDSEVLQIKTTTEKFFVQYLTLKRPIIDMYSSKLSGRSIQVPAKIISVLALLLYNNYLHSDIDDDDKRWNIIFDRGHRNMYCEKLGIKEQQLNTYFSMLRSYKILTGKKIDKPFIIYPDGPEYELTFKFSINGEK